jgi:hypothetical protein
MHIYIMYPVRSTVQSNRDIITDSIHACVCAHTIWYAHMCAITITYMQLTAHLRLYCINFVIPALMFLVILF